jgi:hypothetical protein
MCIDFTSLNKACPKDNFPLPRIDKIVDSAAGCEVMSLLDCFSGYHQIYMKEEDKASTSFITPFGTYCFIRMPEGLKNAGSTFSRLTKTRKSASSVFARARYWATWYHTAASRPTQPRSRPS